MDYQPIFDIATLCVRKKVTQVVMCPGSRCAPLTLAFTRTKGIKARTFSDERSAGFIGLGIAQNTSEPTVLLCTSGTAAYNFAPAVAEAYFSHTPLIIFTADRPAEWIAQQDGQTIFQSEIYGKHVKKSFHLPVDYDHPDSQWAINRTINEAINLSRQHPMGPVHINAPFREPLYPSGGEMMKPSDFVRIIEDHLPVLGLGDNEKKLIQHTLSAGKKILLVVGQHGKDPALTGIIHEIISTLSIPVAGDIISNIHGSDNVLLHTDLFLGQATDKVKSSLRPDLLITFGKSLISKNLKIFLRKYQPGEHWHIQTGGVVADTFKNVTRVFHCDPADFLGVIASVNFKPEEDQKKYQERWLKEERNATTRVHKFVSGSLSELEVVREVIQHLPAGSNLHLANSMSVRYANFIGLDGSQKNIHVHSNRGTSGIDGCTSTAVGHAINSESMHVLITGDVAFFYDRNAFWHNYDIPNLRVLLLNNHGGVIFNMIDGPASQPEAAEYFITRQKLNASNLCSEFRFEYLHLDKKENTTNLVAEFVKDNGRLKVLEVESDVHHNRKIFDQLKQTIKKNYAS
jgi:2-succinyl-5-enolpyruvyl-6-hydroxy-3-cyclohexene-1-carboxylate synthase